MILFGPARTAKSARSLSRPSVVVSSLSMTQIERRWAFALSALVLCCESSNSAAPTDAGSGGVSGSAGAQSRGGSGVSGGAGASSGEHSGGAAVSGGRAAAGNAGRATGGATTGGATTGGAQGTLSERYPDETSLAADPAVLFHDDFESGWGRWNAPTRDTEHLFIEDDAAKAHAGARYLRSTVTEQQLAQDEYISSSTRLDFPKRVDTVFIRFHAYFEGIAPNPHHWVRVAAGTPSYASSGLANTVPQGNQGFWFDFDADIDDRFNFYVYWYKMRSGRCNDGSTTAGCAGDQGTTYHYGNSFQPPAQGALARDRWMCVEMMAKANGVGQSDGALAFWIDDRLVGDYKPGFPSGTWLRDKFHTGGCTFSACTAPTPFEGFDFRSNADVLFKSFFLDAYYERGSSANARAELKSRGLSPSNEQTVLYDDVVIATTRIGCGSGRGAP